MKSLYIKISALAILMIGFTSCEDQLEEYNPGGLTAETVYTTPEGFETLVNAAYSYQRWWYGKEEGYNIAETGTDLWTSGSGDAYPDLTRYLNLQAGNGALANIWREFYAAINLINGGLNNIENADLSPQVRSVREGELRFLRAFYYWHIVETWGGVHFTLSETNGIVSTANRTPVEAFYAQIFEDLEYAVLNLPVTQLQYGRATKPAAQAFLARMYLTRGRNQEALDMAKTVINEYDFQLLPDYADLWLMSNQKNKEVIYAVNYNEDLALNDLANSSLNPYGHGRGSNSGHLLFLMKYDNLPGLTRDITNGRPFVRYAPTRFLLDLFNDADARHEGSFKQYWFANTPTSTLQIGDTAVYITVKEVPDNVEASKDYLIFDRSDTYNPDGSIKDNNRFEQLSKFMDPTRASFNEAQSARDAFVIRLAEMYLIAAEAEMNLNNLSNAADYINVLRNRAAKPGREAEMQVAPAQVTLDFILDERARELAGEQLRWFDLKRTGKLIERINAYNPDNAVHIQPHHILRPIPQQQIDAVTNKDEFIQNPEYQ
ncbi:RagB/SusD family nutrient uptake outer membrane protein [Pontibacter beigongshangensis]|uniref:RagB/SusD family nutrient uptake outer membrane protein n=1 Tax=Pontibacter beigongshangensis TaxID=2574733 RepID=UPI00164FBEF9|nr:RagB/SusD family nutrient uptake outer membrane protein [Pontibacter beigongshangensis]